MFQFPSLKYIISETKGLYHAWNAGIKATNSKYITNLNSDDRLKNNALEAMSHLLDHHPDIGLVYGDNLITETPNETFENNSSNGHSTNWPEYSHKELLIKCICGPHPMWRREIHNEIGYFDESFMMRGDYEFWLRIADKYKILHIPQIIGLYYDNPSGISASSPQLACDEDLRIKLKYFRSD